MTNDKLLLLMLVVLSCSVGSAVGQQTLFYDGHVYQLIKENRTWSNAAGDAAGRLLNGEAGHLVVIEDQEENAALFEFLTFHVPSSEYDRTRAPDGGNGVYVWIGASDLTVEGDWIWDGDGDGTGELFWQGLGRSGGQIIDGRYNNWGHYPTADQQWEPDNSSGGLQDAAGMGVANWPRGFAAEWNDIRATNSLYYLIEFDTLPRLGDLNMDAIVNDDDAAVLTANLFTSGDWRAGDLNDDGLVDGSDFNLWYAHRDASLPPQAVPEPAAVSLLAISTLLLLGQRVKK